MRQQFPKAEKYRLIDNGLHSSSRGDRFGAFAIPTKDGQLRVLVSDGSDRIHWEHVSVSLSHRCPTWEEMSLVKDLFWEPDETVLQFHPKRSAYINQHPWTLHLWKLRGVDHKLPPLECV